MSNVDTPNIDDQLPDEPTCIHCGCTEDNACEGGCVWICQDPPICSSCMNKVELTDEEWKELGENMAAVADAAHQAAVQLSELQGQTQGMVNLLTVLVNREGGSLRVSKIELDGIHGCKLNSKADPEANAVVLSVERFDPLTGEKQGSIILPGFIPPIGL